MTSFLFPLRKSCLCNPLYMYVLVVAKLFPNNFHLEKFNRNMILIHEREVYYCPVIGQLCAARNYGSDLLDSSITWRLGLSLAAPRRPQPPPVTHYTAITLQYGHSSFGETIYQLISFNRFIYSAGQCWRNSHNFLIDWQQKIWEKNVLLKNREY